MSKLITLEDISLAYGLDALLEKASFQIAEGERVCLIGRNGAGKSSLLKIIEGSLQPDQGKVWRKPALQIARLEQTLPSHADLTVFDFVAQGLAETGKLLSDYHHLTQQLSKHASQQDLNRLERLQHKIETVNGWQFDQDIQTVLTKLELNPEAKLGSLSGGWQRRAALAKALVGTPSLLLLDEPTNHLDVEAIQWLEAFLLKSQIALVFVTHDRVFLQKLATRIIELDRGKLTSWPGDYQQFLLHKEEMLHAEAKHHADFDKKLAQEEKWIRQGIKARRTRNEGRVRALQAMRLERSKRREVQGNVKLSLSDAIKSGRLVVAAEKISHEYSERKLINHFSLRVMRGDRIGLIGPNGIGKSTLLNLLLGKIKPQQGRITLGTHLNIAYFDQLREALDPEKTVAENVSEGSDTIEINGNKRHIISYLSDFLFSPQRVLTPVKALSGGECNRLLLARLFSQPANLLVMDEPTNDLDIETLELLEEKLSQFKGTLLLVSHDRKFLDNVVTSTLVFEGNGRIQEYAGGYEDYLRQRTHSLETSQIKKKSIVSDVQKKPKKQSNKLSYKEQRELEELPGKIERLEQEQAMLQEKVSDPGFYQQEQSAITPSLERLSKISKELEAAYARWEMLLDV